MSNPLNLKSRSPRGLLLTMVSLWQEIYRTSTLISSDGLMQLLFRTHRWGWHLWAWTVCTWRRGGGSIPAAFLLWRRRNVYSQSVHRAGQEYSECHRIWESYIYDINLIFPQILFFFTGNMCGSIYKKIIYLFFLLSFYRTSWIIFYVT